jgi:hypothetical protein
MLVFCDEGARRSSGTVAEETTPRVQGGGAAGVANSAFTDDNEGLLS